MPNELDIWINNTKENVKKINEIFDLDTDAEFYIKLNSGFSQIDILSSMDGLTYLTSKQKSKEYIFKTESISYICLQDIIINKIKVNRQKDIFDIKMIGQCLQL